MNRLTNPQDRPADVAGVPLSRRQVCGGALAALVGAGAFGQAAAQGRYPDGTISVVAPFVPGGPNDMVARAVANGLAEAFGVTVTVDNRSGAGGNIGTQHVLQQPADGRTLLLGAAYLVVSPHLFKSVHYDPVRDFVPVGPPVESRLVFVTRPDGPDLKDMLAKAKATGVPLKLASPGAGTLSHLGGEALSLASGAPMTHIAYRGVGPAVTDVLGGHVDLMLDGMASSLPLIKAGRAKGLAVPEEAREPLLPDVPSLAELGYPGMTIRAWNAAFVVAATPRPIVDKLTAEVTRTLAKPEVVKALTARGLRPTTLSPAQFHQRMAEESARWQKVIRDAKISLG
jgi:tripartite-type tricarboxylate transporter receptor subunit TctC